VAVTQTGKSRGNVRQRAHKKFHSNLTLTTSVTRQKLDSLIIGQIVKQQYTPSLRGEKCSSKAQIVVRMTLKKLIQQAVRITPPLSDKCHQHLKREKLFNPYTDTNCTYIENVLPYHTNFFLNSNNNNNNNCAD